MNRRRLFALLAAAPLAAFAVWRVKPSLTAREVRLAINKMRFVLGDTYFEHIELLDKPTRSFLYGVPYHHTATPGGTWLGIRR